MAQDKAAKTENQDVDVKGERGGDTGPSKRPKGENAEKGDRRREKPTHPGPTRPGGSSRGRPGSDSNPEKDE
jgi:hypothetical protein